MRFSFPLPFLKFWLAYPLAKGLGLGWLAKGLTLHDRAAQSVSRSTAGERAFSVSSPC